MLYRLRTFQPSTQFCTTKHFVKHFSTRYSYFPKVIGLKNLQTESNHKTSNWRINYHGNWKTCKPNQIIKPLTDESIMDGPHFEELILLQVLKQFFWVLKQFFWVLKKASLVWNSVGGSQLLCCEQPMKSIAQYDPSLSFHAY